MIIDTGQCPTKVFAIVTCHSFANLIKQAALKPSTKQDLLITGEAFFVARRSILTLAEDTILTRIVGRQPALRARLFHDELTLQCGPTAK
jgi:hypothetical protein